MEAHRKIGEDDSVETHIGLRGLFPFQVRIGRGIGAVPDLVSVAEGIVAAPADRRYELEITDIIISRDTIGSPDFQEVDGMGRRPEVFPGHYPAYLRRRKITIFVIAAEPRRPIPA